MRALMLLILIGVCTAAEVQWPAVPDPLGLGPRLALVDWLHQQGVTVPAGASDEKLLELYAVRNDGGGNGLPKRLDPIPEKLQIEWTGVHWNNEPRPATISGNIERMKVTWNGTTYVPNELTSQGTAVIVQIKSTSLIFNIREGNSVDNKGRISADVEITYADASGDRRVGHLLGAYIKSQGEITIGAMPKQEPTGYIPVPAQPQVQRGTVVTDHVEQPKPKQEVLRPFYKKTNPEMFDEAYWPNFSLAPVSARDGVQVYLLHKDGDDTHFWLWVRSRVGGVAPGTVVRVFIDDHEYGIVVGPTHGEYIIPMPILPGDSGKSLLLRSK